MRRHVLAPSDSKHRELVVESKTTEALLQNFKAYTPCVCMRTGFEWSPGKRECVCLRLPVAGLASKQRLNMRPCKVRQPRARHLALHDDDDYKSSK